MFHLSKENILEISGSLPEQAEEKLADPGSSGKTSLKRRC